MRDLPPSERPRQRLAEVGSWALSDAELLAVLLNTGTCGRSVAQKAARFLADSGGLAGVSEMGVDELLAIPGFGKATAATLIAAVELGQRLATATLNDSPRLSEIEAAGDYLVKLLQDEQRDLFGFLSLDSYHRQIGLRELSIEDRDAVPFDDLTTAVLRRALHDSAAGIMLFHHQPSGELVLGWIEVELTRRLVGPCAAAAVPLLDTFVVGDGGWISLREQRPRLFDVGEQ
jgi:DNA repair protein RadC